MLNEEHGAFPHKPLWIRYGTGSGTGAEETLWADYAVCAVCGVPTEVKDAMPSKAP